MTELLIDWQTYMPTALSISAFSTIVNNYPNIANYDIRLYKIILKYLIQNNFEKTGYFAHTTYNPEINDWISYYELSEIVLNVKLKYGIILSIIDDEIVVQDFYKKCSPIHISRDNLLIYGYLKEQKINNIVNMKKNMKKELTMNKIRKDMVSTTLVIISKITHHQIKW